MNLLLIGMFKPLVYGNVARYYRRMIKTFANKETAALFTGERPRRFALNGLSTAMRKMAQLDVVQNINELLIPSGNRLEKLSRDRQGQYSIRINDQWRLCFRFVDGHAY